MVHAFGPERHWRWRPADASLRLRLRSVSLTLGQCFMPVARAQAVSAACCRVVSAGTTGNFVTLQYPSSVGKVALARVPERYQPGVFSVRARARIWCLAH